MFCFVFFMSMMMILRPRLIHGDSIRPVPSVLILIAPLLPTLLLYHAIASNANFSTVMISENSNDASVANRSDDNTNDALDTLRRANWAGKIPVRLTLAETSLSSGTPPHPQHVLLSRNTFLHLGLETAVRKLHEYSLPTLSFGTTSKVVVQEDDEDNRRVNEKKTAAETPADESMDDEISAATNQKDDANSDASGNDKSSNCKDNKAVGTSVGGDGEEEIVSEPKELSPYPICWFEDIATRQPLRWQYFVGVLFDSLQPACRPSPSEPSDNSGTSTSSPDAASLRQTTQPRLPWELCVHFGSYPSQQLLELCDAGWGYPCGVRETIRQSFRNSLKQGFVIRYGNSKEALNLSKQAHDDIWDAIVQGNYEAIAPIVYRDDEIDPDTATSTTATTEKKGEDGTSKNTIEKAMKNDASGSDIEDSLVGDDDESSPEKVDDIQTTDDDQDTMDLQQDCHQQNKGFNENTENQAQNNLVMVPVRLSIDPTKPMIQRRYDGGNAASIATLGSLLHEWAPSHFGYAANDVVETEDNGTTQNEIQQKGERKDGRSLNSNDTRRIQPLRKDITWKVAGLTPPLSTPLLDLWVALRHPDNFLYVSISL